MSFSESFGENSDWYLGDQRAEKPDTAAITMIDCRIILPSFYHPTMKKGNR